MGGQRQLATSTTLVESYFPYFVEKMGWSADDGRREWRVFDSRSLIKIS
jgi:hypothetical protein